MRADHLFLTTLLLGVITAVPVFGQNAPTVSIEGQEGTPGQSIDVPVQVSGFEDIGAISLTISYDPAVLSFPAGAETSDLIAGAPRDNFSANVSEPGELVISWFDATAADPISLGSATLLEITFSEFSGGTSTIGFADGSEIADSQGSPYNASFEGGEVEEVTTQIDVSASRSFEDSSDPSNYELVALPGQVDVDVAQTLSGNQGTEWRAFRELGASGDSGNASLEEYDGSESFNFRPGRGFWVISQNEWSFEGAVPPVQRGGGTASIPLQEGWNAISNPLATDVSWASLQSANGFSEALWQWSDGGWEQAQTLASASQGQAYYVFNGTGLDSLDFPSGSASVDGNTSRKNERLRWSYARQVREVSQGPRAPDRVVRSLNGRSRSAYISEERSRKTVALGCGKMRTIELQARVDGQQVSKVTVGVSETLDTPDTYRAPPGHFTDTTLRIMGKEERSAFARMVVPANNCAHSFSLRLKGPPESTVVLATSSLAEWSNGEVRLVNQKNGETYDLRSKSELKISLLEENRPIPLRLHVKASR